MSQGSSNDHDFNNHYFKCSLILTSPFPWLVCKNWNICKMFSNTEVRLKPQQVRPEWLHGKVGHRDWRGTSRAWRKKQWSWGSVIEGNNQQEISSPKGLVLEHLGKCERRFEAIQECSSAAGWFQVQPYTIWRQMRTSLWGELQLSCRIRLNPGEPGSDWTPENLDQTEPRRTWIRLNPGKPGLGWTLENLLLLVLLESLGDNRPVAMTTTYYFCFLFEVWGANGGRTTTDAHFMSACPPQLNRNISLLSHLI